MIFFCPLVEVPLLFFNFER